MTRRASGPSRFELRFQPCPIEPQMARNLALAQVAAALEQIRSPFGEQHRARRCRRMLVPAVGEDRYRRRGKRGVSRIGFRLVREVRTSGRRHSDSARPALRSPSRGAAVGSWTARWFDYACQAIPYRPATSSTPSGRLDSPRYAESPGVWCVLTASMPISPSRKPSRTLAATPPRKHSRDLCDTPSIRARSSEPRKSSAAIKRYRNTWQFLGSD